MNTACLQVLLIEDNVQDTHLVRGLLTGLPEAPLALEWAPDLRTGRKRLAEGKFDVVLLDLWLPESQGLATLQTLRAEAAVVPIVVLTGAADEALGLAAIQAGAQDYLLKSEVSRHSLVRAVRYAHGQMRWRRAEEALRASRQESAADRRELQDQLRQHQHELAETTTLLNSILEGATEYAIVATDLAGTILTWNEGARRIYGYTAAEMVGRPIGVLHQEADLTSGRVQALNEMALRSGKTEGTFDRVRKDGSRFLAATVVTLRRGADGSAAGFVRITRDITGQKSLEEQLRRQSAELAEQNRRVQEANRLKSEFLANMSHELRTPLNSIIGFAELMYDGKVGPISAPHKEYLGDILTSARHLLQLINDILDLAKVEAGTTELRPVPIDLAQLTGEICTILRGQAARKRIRIDTWLAPALQRVIADPPKLKQVLYNYLSNALKFTPDEGRVTIRVSPEGEDAFRLEVADTGIGIQAEDMGRLFVAFQQLEAGADKRYPGTGLGLALTRQIVEAQGGRVGVHSTAGQGSTFFAVLPRVARRTAPAEAPPRLPPAPPGAPAILVIEDNPQERAWLGTVLAGAGYAVECAADGAEAIARCRQRAFDAITLDLLLPDMNARDILRAITTQTDGRNAQAPVVVLTVVAEPGAVAGFNIHDFLVKPIQSDELLASLYRAGVAPERSPRVLVVDDDPAALKLMEATLAHLGYQPLCRADGAAGLATVESERPAAIVLDLLMPAMDGFEFLERFRQSPAGPHTPVIVWTAKELTAEDRARLRAMAQGVVLKSHGGVAPLLAELQQHLSPPPAATEGGSDGR